MEWLTFIKNGMVILCALDIVINWSYYKKVPAFDVSEKADVYFKSQWHKKFHYGISIVFAIVGSVVLIKWIFF